MDKLEHDMIGIFGGSFDPPHRGHRHIIRSFWKNFPKAKNLYIVPNRISPLKKNKIASTSETLTLLEIFLQELNNSKNCISTYEISQKKPNYSIDTIQYFKKKFPKDEILFLIGEDNLLEFHLWKDPEKILSLATLVVFKRRSLGKKNQIRSENLEGLLKKYKKKIVRIKNRMHNTSSSEIRNLLRTKNQHVKKLNRTLGKQILTYLSSQKSSYMKN